MGLWGALQGAMRTRRTRRIGLAEADRLVAGKLSSPDPWGLGVLLDAAKAPPSVDELAGERAAVAGFLAAHRNAAATAQSKRRNRAQLRLSTRAVALKVAAAVTVLAMGGTAVAAQTGKLPAGAQQRVHDMLSSLGVPAPDGGPRPASTGPVRPSTSAQPSATPTPPISAAPADAAALTLCRQWDAARQKPHGKAMTAEAKHALVEAAGGQSKIAAFCTALLDNPPATPGPATATPSQPAAGNGNSKGKGHGSTRPSPDPQDPHGK
jgi:hypothetical protein